MVAVRVVVGVKVMVGVGVIVGVKDGVGLGPSVLLAVAVGVREGVSVIVEVVGCVGVWVGVVGVSTVAVGVSVRDAAAVIEGVGVGAVSSCTTRTKSAADTRPSIFASDPGHEFWPKMAATTASRSEDSMTPLQLASPASTSAPARAGCI